MPLEHCWKLIQYAYPERSLLWACSSTGILSNSPASFLFDENRSVDDNLAAFFEHLKASDEEFGTHLAEKLPQAVEGSFSRQV